MKKWAAFDIETLTYLDGELVSMDELTARSLTMRDSEKRARVRVEVALLQVYEPVNGFKMFKGPTLWEDMLQYCCFEGISQLWDYNAVFDFANMDYWLLNNPRAERMIITEENTDKGGYRHKLGKQTLGDRILFKELSGNMGQRYMYELHYVGRSKNRHTRAYKLTFYDFKNILKGGLAQILEDLDVEDEAGNKLRKLKMDYQAVDYESMTVDERAYVELDVKGLYYAILKFSKNLEKATDGRRSLVGASKPSGMTASGIAKKELLYYLGGNARDDLNVKRFQRKHPLTLKQDIYLRETKLYRGGICYLNSEMCNKPIVRQFYRYDVNSEYPSVMAEMRDLYGKLKQCSLEYYAKEKDNPNKCFILRFNELAWTLRENQVPIFTNPFTGKNKVSDRISKGKGNKYGFCIFAEEFEELQKFYEFTYDIDNILVINAREIKGYKNFVSAFYKLKTEAKKAGNPALCANAKLMLNGSYGKLSERSDRKEVQHQLNKETGCVHQIEIADESPTYSGLSIIQGAYVTALARIKIMKYMRRICGDNLRENFIYVDTDSVHGFKEFTDSDPYALGAMKLEAVCQRGIFLGKKLYAEFEGERGCAGEVHSKGVTITALCRSILNDFNVDSMDDLEFRDFCKRFAFGEQFTINAGINVIGGKSILPIRKELIKFTLLKENTQSLVRTGKDEFMEV